MAAAQVNITGDLDGPGAEATPQPGEDDRVHIPRFMPFFWLGAAALAGAVLAEGVKLPWTWWAGGLTASLAAVLFRAWLHRDQPRRPRVPMAALLGAACLTALLYQLSLPARGPGNIAFYNQQGYVDVTALVLEPPEARQNSIQLVAEAETVSSREMAVTGHEVAGKILVEVPLGSDFQYGDRIRVYGELIEPPAGSTFAYDVYLAHRGIYVLSQYARVEVVQSGQGSPLRDAIYRLREAGIRVLNDIFPSPENALLRGILLGDESGLSSELRDAYSLTGTAHIIAISGFNMAVLAGVVSRLFTKHLGMLKGGLVAVITLAFYTVLVGASASVVRAAVMGSFAILGAAVSRRGNVLNNLGLSVFAMMLLNPHLPWDLGFQLSVLATLGLALFAAPAQVRLSRWLSRHFSEAAASLLGSVLSEYVLLTLIAQVMVLPLIIYNFREVSWLFLVANPLILPLQPAVMMLGMLALAGGLLSRGLGTAFAWLAWPAAYLTNRIVTGLARLAPNAWRFPRIDTVWLLLYYFLLSMVTMKRSDQQAGREIFKPAPLLITLTSLVLVLWTSAAGRPDGTSTLRVFGAAEAPLVLITTGEGRHILVGGSLPANSLSAQVSGWMAPFSREIDMLIIPECTKAQVGGLFGLAEQVKVRQVLWGCDPGRIRSTERLYDAFAGLGIPQHDLQPGDMLRLGAGSQLVFRMGDGQLSGLQLTDGLFSAAVTLEEGFDPGTGEFSVLIGGEEGDKCAQVIVLTGEVGNQSGETCRVLPLVASEYQWLAIRTDGENMWIAGNK